MACNMNSNNFLSQPKPFINSTDDAIILVELPNVSSKKRCLTPDVLECANSVTVHPKTTLDPTTPEPSIIQMHSTDRYFDNQDVFLPEFGEEVDSDDYEIDYPSDDDDIEGRFYRGEIRCGPSPSDYADCADYD